MEDTSAKVHSSWPDDVGILSLELYFPYTYVDQAKLEEYDGVSTGKYTIGLGQSGMGFCGDREDVHSLALTAVQNLLDRNLIDPRTIGRLEVGTETIIDKSKSVKSVLMQLFEECGNTNIEGIDTKNACYGGTQALFNAVDWVESSSWDGRLAIVVAADIAVYAKGNSRPSGGAGAVAMLVGPNAPLVIERGLRAVHMQHKYDFYKPDMVSEYPQVDGKLSIKCYFHALDQCYRRYMDRLEKRTSKSPCSMDDVDFFVFHTPFCKIVQKSVGRLLFHDFLRGSSVATQEAKCFTGLGKFRDVKLQDTFEDEGKAKEIERASMKCSQDIFAAKTKPSINIAQHVGNMYTPSLYGSLVSLLISVPVEQLASKRVALFSYGSGLASAMFSLRISEDAGPSSMLSSLVGSLQDIPSRLSARREVEPRDFVATLNWREQTHHIKDFSPIGSTENLFPGTFFLAQVDGKFCRSYERKPRHPTGEKHINGEINGDACQF